MSLAKGSRVALEIIRLQAGPLGDASQHFRPDFAARTRRALVAGQLLIWNGEGNGECRRCHFTVSNAVRNHLNRQPFSIADCLIARLPIAHHTRQFEGFGDPATVVFTIQFNGQFHCSIISSHALRLRMAPAQQPLVAPRAWFSLDNERIIIYPILQNDKSWPPVIYAGRHEA